MYYEINNYRPLGESDEVQSLLNEVYVSAGYTDLSAIGMFSFSEVQKRGHIISARIVNGRLAGMIICGFAANPYKQVAQEDEAEMQLLAVHPDFRKIGLGKALINAFEKKAISLGYERFVLSTQPSMTSAHRLYEELGYSRNKDRDWSRAEKKFYVFQKFKNNLS